MRTRTIARTSASALAATGLAISLAATAHAAGGTPDGASFSAAGGGGSVTWVDNGDQIVVWDDRPDGHGVWVKVEHPTEGRLIFRNTSGAYSGIYYSVPNLPNNQGMGVTVCLQESGEKISSTCRTHWIVE